MSCVCFNSLTFKSGNLSIANIPLSASSLPPLSFSSSSEEEESRYCLKRACSIDLMEVRHRRIEEVRRARLGGGEGRDRMEEERADMYEEE